MRLWMSGELHHEVADAYRAARRTVENAYNERFADTDYGSSVVEWAHVAMIAPPGWGYEQEVQRYHRRDRSLEFRLRVPFDAFLAAEALGRQRLLIAMLRRSLDLVPTLQVRELDLAHWQADVTSFALEHGWL